MKESEKPVRVGMIALGCNKNQVDAELMLGTLSKAGFEISEDAGDCDVVIVNTCGFIESAKRESIETNLLSCFLPTSAQRLSGMIPALVIR